MWFLLYTTKASLTSVCATNTSRRRQFESVLSFKRIQHTAVQNRQPRLLGDANNAATLTHKKSKQTTSSSLSLLQVRTHKLATL